MRAIRTGRLVSLTVLAALLLVPTQALASRAFSAEGTFDGRQSPAGSFDGACGVAVDPVGDIYVADYYHHVVDVYSSGHQYVAQLKLPGVNGPCGLAVDSTGRLYVDTYHEAVIRYAPSFFPPGVGVTYGAGTVLDAADPTGVALDPASGDLYVDERTAVAVFDPSGSPLRRIELPPGADAYGAAVSEAPGSEGDVYVADAATDEIEAYGPAGTPIGLIDGGGDPRRGFVTLADAALAVDQTSGDLLVAEDIQPGFEAPAAAVEEFGPSGEYLGELGHPVVDAVPSGLTTTAAGALYVGSGNGPGASVLAFGVAGSEPLLRATGFGTDEPALGSGVSPGPMPARVMAPTSTGTLEVDSRAGVLRVVAPGPGILTVQGRRLSPLRRRVGTKALLLRPSLDRGGQRALARGGRLNIIARLKFEADQPGPALERRVSIVFGRHYGVGSR